MLIRRIGLLLVGLRWVPLGFSIVAPFPLVAFGVRPLALGIILLGSVNLCPWVRPPNLILEWLGVLDGSLILTDSVVGHLSRCQNAIQKIPDGVRLIELAASGRAAGAALFIKQLVRKKLHRTCDVYLFIIMDRTDTHYIVAWTSIDVSYQIFSCCI